MADSSESPFFDVPMLLARSMPRQRINWFWHILAGFILLIVLSSYLQRTYANLRTLIDLFSMFSMFALICVLGLLSWLTARRAGEEQSRVQAVEELLQLRRWADAGLLLHDMLLKPARSMQTRFQTLFYFATVLARFHRFGEAISVYDHLLEFEGLDPTTTHAIKLGRTMSLLREDRLFDADRAINELRRTENAQQSAGLALLEIYRDVKTGHPREAIELFEQRKDLLIAQLGHRSADAWILLAKAHDFVGETESARIAFENATVLSPVLELTRRYPETADLPSKYAPVPPPQGAGGAIQ